MKRQSSEAQWAQSAQPVIRLQTAVLLCLLNAVPLAAQTIAITGGTVIPVSGPRIENGTVLIRDGVIAAVGTTVAVPDGAQRIDARGKIVTPGLINAFTQLGLTEVDLAPGTVESSVRSDVAAAFNVAEGINPASTLIPVTRIEGITSALVAPVDSFIAGQSVFIDLTDGPIEQMVVRSPVAMHVTLDEAAKHAGGGSRAGVAERLRRILRDAQAYGQRRSDYERRQMRDLAAPAADLEALQSVLAGRIPLVVTAHRVSDMRTAMRIAREFNLRLVLAGAAEGWQIAAEIARANVPVLVEPLANIPSFNALGARYENPARLAAAGVKVALVAGAGPGGTAHNARIVKQEAGNAVAYGMDWDAALRALTLGPAEILGVADRYGSLEPGRVANVVVWSGDPLEFSTAVEHVIIRGREIPLTSRQSELLERYRTLPPRY